jgi:hypothetical protein
LNSEGPATAIGWSALARRFWLLLSVYVLATCLQMPILWLTLTQPRLPGLQRVFYRRPQLRVPEFGHVFWRPLGWLLSVVCQPQTSVVSGCDVHMRMEREELLPAKASRLVFRGYEVGAGRNDGRCAGVQRRRDCAAPRRTNEEASG